MVTFGDALGTAVRDTFCAITNQVGGTAGLIGDSIGRLPFDNGATGNVQNFFQALGQVSCGNAPVANGAIDPGFTGGQCPGVGYTVSGRLRQFNASGSQIFNGIIGTSGVGPVSLATRNRDDGGEILEWIFGDGSNFVVSSVPPDFTYTYTEISVVRNDGQPDNCGNPDSPVVPYNPEDYTYNPDVTYDDPGGNPITIPVGLIFAPVFINANAEVTIPVRVDFSPEITLFGELNLTTGDFNLNLGKGGETGDPTDDEPSDEEEGPIIAVRVDIISIEPGYGRQEILPFAPNSASLWIPRLASVRFLARFLTEAGSSSTLHWTQDIDVRMTQSVIECPVHWGARRVVVEPSPGVNLNFTPIYAKSIRQLLMEKTEA